VRPHRSALNGARVHVPAGAAIDDPATLASLRAYGRRATLLLALAVGAAVGAVVLLSAESRAAAQLLRAGVRTEGVVVAAGGGAHDGNLATVEYLVEGANRRGTIRYSGSQHYFQGEPVQVIYDPRDASHIRTARDANDDGFGKGIAVYALIAALVMALGSARAAARPWRWRKLLQHPWRPYVSICEPARRRGGERSVQLVRLGGATGTPVTLRLRPVTRRRAARLAGERVVWVAGDPAGEIVLALPLTRELYPARAPRGWGGRHRPAGLRERARPLHLSH